MHSISLEKAAALMRGTIVSRGGRHLIPLDGCRFYLNHPTSITFLSKPVKSEPALLCYLKKNNVRCLVVPPLNRLTIAKWRKSGIAIIKVRNLTMAYMALAQFYRKQFSIPHVQVIGSSGKTTTKEMIGQVLKRKYRTLIGLNNLNAFLGITRNLLRLTDSHQAAVLEAGMKGPGIISTCSRLIRPKIGVITSIHRAHLIRMGSINRIIAAKAEILRYIPKNGALIINWNDANCRRLPLGRCKGKIIRVGFSERCDIWASEVQQQDFCTTFIVHAGELIFPCSINIIGQYNVSNALAAIATGLEMRIKPEEIVRGLHHFKPLDRRLKVYRARNGTFIIDDNFNANPDSTRLLIDELIVMAQTQSLVLVIGDMERPSAAIGKYACSVHFKIGQQIAKGNFTHVLAIGRWAREYVSGALQNGFPENNITYHRTAKSAENNFKKLLLPGTTVVLKASPYTSLHTLRIKALKQPYQKIPD